MEIIKSEKGYLTILTGKTDMGKSTITIYDASEFLKMGQNVIFFSYEYCQSIIYNKLISHFGVGWPTLFHLNIVDAMGLGVQALTEIVRAKREDVSAVYIDYLDLLQKSTFIKPEGETEDLRQIQKIIEDLAALAQELNIPIILLSQVGSSSNFEEAVSRLNGFTETVKGKNTIKMFIGKGNVIDPRISYDDIVHIILVDGYDLRHFSSVNIKEIYGDK
jgi:hypothetical protein